MKTYEYNMVAGQTVVGPGGNYFVLITAGDDGVDLSFSINDSTEVNANDVNAGFKINTPFEFVRIYATTTLKLKFCVSRINSSYDVVATYIDSNLSRDAAHLFGNIISPAVALFTSQAMIYNQSTTDSLKISNLSISIGTSIVAYRMYYNTSITGFIDLGFAPSKIIGTYSDRCKLMHKNDTVGHLGTTIYDATQYILLGSSHVYNPIPMAVNCPFVIPPGSGLSFASNTVNTPLDIIFDGFY